MNTISQLKQTNLRDQALAVLKLRLISGDIKPGVIYSAAALATELGVSNSPVREAMLTLVNHGLMEAVRNRGFRVVPLSDRERKNIYDLRIMLEVPTMGRLAKLSISKEQEKTFLAIAREIVNCAKDSDIAGYLDADRRFHLGLLNLLENEQLTAIVENLRDQTFQYGLKALTRNGELVSSAEEHLAILDAIVKGNQEMAEDLMAKHLGHIRGNWAGASPTAAHVA